MHNFEFHNRVRILFGKGEIAKLGEQAKPYGKKALFVYGKGSIKRTGVYDQAVESLKAAGIEIVEYPGVKPNPLLSHAEEGAALAKREGVDMVIAVGGGSVIDESKAIAAGAVCDTPIWDFFTGKAEVEKALPVFTVLTIAAAGSEMNGGLVLTNEANNSKLGLVKEPLQPICSILDPSTTFTVDAKYTAYSAVDACCHVMESYMTSEDPATGVQDRYVEGIVRTVVETTPKILANPIDYDARATFMWAATMAWNGLHMVGVGPFCMPNHFMGHSMSALCDTPHGASLSVALPAWMTWYAKDQGKPRKIAQLARRVFDVDIEDDTEAAMNGIELFAQWCEEIGSPTTFTEANIPLDMADALAQNAAENRERWGLPDYTKERVLEVLKPAIV